MIFIYLLHWKSLYSPKIVHVLFSRIAKTMYEVFRSAEANQLKANIYALSYN